MATCLTETTILGIKQSNNKVLNYNIKVKVSCNNNMQLWEYIVTDITYDRLDALSNFSVEICETFTESNFIDRGGGKVNDSGQGNCLNNLPATIHWDKNNGTIDPNNLNKITFSFILDGCFEKIPGIVAIKDGDIKNPSDPNLPKCMFGEDEICTPGCNQKPLKQRPPRGTPFSEEEITPIFRSDKK
ncbi:hypothetical protein [Tepidibacter formicigenes]|jgi:hypothetical protein|uniref:Uncharacterized protein n=1 Tax=Tepidibacter formicigenes DSM 15518 TaxID=1123349 RepID=A0A1M6N1Z4_9FIRM|nr:hypothetical protein [Tepidibacter formicigenes]SHJ89727.1 hypothetical protein SAMN02744037_01140 [Tepidibacter formicigenes DSM 15518]